MNYLKVLKPADFKNKNLPAEEILKWFEACQASWVHSGNPTDPHAELTSGKCSNGFFNCLKVLKFYTLSEILANQLAKKIRVLIGSAHVDVVISSPMAAITFGHEVGKVLGADIFLFTEKDPINPKTMLFKRDLIPESANVLQIEELVTTSHTTNAVKKVIDQAHRYPIHWLPFIGMLVHRPPQLVNEYNGREVVSLIEKQIWAVDPSECKLCRQGSKRYRPKTNWEKLTGKA